MASTNKTTTLDLSQFVGTDKPDWLTDYNEDMEKIDAWATSAESDINTANNNADSAKVSAQSASTAATTAVNTATQALTSADNANAKFTNTVSYPVTISVSGWTGGVTITLNNALKLFHLNGIMLGSSTNIKEGTKIGQISDSKAYPSKTITLFGVGASSDKSPLNIQITPLGEVKTYGTYNSSTSLNMSACFFNV
nr:MAG TPA: hypothetical protein [Caudoviricetes sp.]